MKKIEILLFLLLITAVPAEAYFEDIAAVKYRYVPPEDSIDIAEVAGSGARLLETGEYLGERDRLFYVFVLYKYRGDPVFVMEDNRGMIVQYGSVAEDGELMIFNAKVMISYESGEEGIVKIKTVVFTERDWREGNLLHEARIRAFIQYEFYKQEKHIVNFPSKKRDGGLTDITVLNTHDVG